MSRSEQKIGKAGESIAASVLRSLGVEMVEKIATPVLVSRVRGRPVVIAWEEPVSGDHRGILPGSGRSVLAETKTILNRNLCWSDLRPHQPGKLTEHTHFGGLTILVWVHSSGAYPLLWPVENFGPGKSISPEWAEENRIWNIIL